MKLAWLMLDGVGLRHHDLDHPFGGLELPALEQLGISQAQNHSSPERFTQAIDANLEIDGLPQSGTGQTTILSGINAAKHLGFHHGPWVSPSLRPLLEQNILKRLGDVRLANYYPERYLESLATGKTRLNAIATAALSANAKLEGGTGLGIPPMLCFPDTDGLRFPETEQTTPKQIQNWAEAFMQSTNQITIFDLWWTDHVGHEQNKAEARAFALRLEAFCQHCIATREPDTLFLISSDHGNFEDLSVKTHTRNSVPFAVVGKAAPHFFNVRSLVDIASALESAFLA